jgi:hypothetical protein
LANDAALTQGVIHAMMPRLKTRSAVFLSVGLVMGGFGWPTSRVQSAPENTPLREETFDQLRKQIRPQPGESRWMDIPWLIDVHEARRKAAAEGKPLFVYSGGGATGIGPC